MSSLVDIIIYMKPLSLKGYQKLPKGLRKGLAAIAKKLPGIKGKRFYNHEAVKMLKKDLLEMPICSQLKKGKSI